MTSDGPFRVALLGHGTVGAAFHELLDSRADAIAAEAGRRPEVVGVLTRSRGDFDDLLERSDLVVELMGGTDPAREYVLRALGAGRHVVTANKQLLSQFGEEIFDAARENQVQLRFEGAVAGVVPAIRVMGETLAAAHIERVHGIVNGTTNYILTEMARTGASYEDALRDAQELGYAEADPTEDVTGKDAAAKMAILARLAFNAAVHLDEVSYEGIEQITADDIEYAKQLGLSLKLIGSAERIGSGIAVYVHPAFLYAGHPLASVNGAYNAVTIESPAITEITLSGPGAGGPQTASAVLGDVISAIIPPPSLPPPAVTQRIVTDVEFSFYLHLEVADHPGVLAQVAEILGLQGVSIRSVVQHGLGGDARLVMVMHPVLESRFRAAVDLISRLDFVRSDAAGHPRDRRGVRVAVEPTQGLWRYRDRLPVDPLVTLGEGDTPLVPAPHLSELTGCQVWLKLEGANPTGSFKDRGMTVAVSAAIRERAEAVVCASTGNTAASAAAYAARAGLRGAVIVPEGKIATGKLAQALMHGARVVALRGNFDEALALVRELAKRHPIALVNSVNDFRIEGQKTGAFEVCDQLGEAPDVLCVPVGNAGNVTAWWRGFQEYDVAPKLHGYQAEGAAPLVQGAPVENPETVASAIRIGNPARWEDAMSAFTSSRGEVRAVSDDEILAAYSLLGAREGVFCEPASAASVAGLLRYGAEGIVVCVLTGHGLKDPQTAMSRATSVVPCEPDIDSVERAVLA